jgi:putative peptide zinc metalloprotease protein
MFSAPDASTVDLTRTRLALRPDLKFTAQVYGDETFYHVEVPSCSEFYRIGYTEYVFLSLLDGRTTFCEALAITARTQGADAFSQQQALSLYSWLLERGIADFAGESSGAGDSGTKKKKPEGNLLQKCNPFWIRLPFGCPDDMLKRLQPFLGWLFSPIATVIALCVMLLAAFQVGQDWQKFQAAATTVFAPDNWLWLLVAWLILKLIHEMAHGLTCQRYGGGVRETGVIFAFFAPLAYVDVTSSWGFSSRWQRIHTAAAGMYVELLLASVAVFAWSHMESQLLSHLMYNVIVMASLSTLLFNANPLMRFDGYYILSDLLNIPNLYTRSSEAVQQLFGRLLLGLRATAPAVTGRHLWTLRVYGLAATFWRLLICATLMIAASVFFHGAGIFLAVAGLVAWFGLPAWNAIQATIRLRESDPARLLRGGVVVSLFLALTCGILFGLPVPFASTAPGTVELHEGCRIRSNVDGFVTTVMVTDGQLVNRGDLLITLQNDELVTQ